MGPPTLSDTLLRAFVWLAIAFVAGMLGAFVIGFACGLMNGARIAEISQANLQGATFIGALLASAYAFNRGALRETSRARDPRIRTSIGPQRIQRWPVMAIAALILTPFGVYLASALAHMSPQMRQTSLDTQPLLLAIAVGLTATLTPYAEERFFRGWLWTAVGLRLGVVGAALVTGALFVFAHVTEALLHGAFAGALARGLLLLPLAVVLSIVRALCKSPRASIIVHGLYNFAVTAAPVVVASMTR